LLVGHKGNYFLGPRSGQEDRRFFNSRHWSKFKRIVKKTKRIFFNKKIQEIISKNKRSWDLMNWVKKCKLSAIEAIKFNRHSYIKLNEFWQVLY